MKTLVIILLSSVLVNNYVLSRFLGICPFLGVSKKLNQAVGMGVSVTVVMLLATLVTWPIQHLVLDRFGLGYLQTIVVILIIASIVQSLEIILNNLRGAYFVQTKLRMAVKIPAQLDQLVAEGRNCGFKIHM